ncbi:MAG TPA: adenylate/guanylate cyclase domain-containing protein [Oligoflexus sp.]|uniref:adenylate/guanylate cyclase domain-containing protein n=1 Tax=Oligoflexus sp. TaxID=1971216 RepID=UPI002D51DB9D|nr:adenylate/guanylate cyclase domain-containing protein [Oligoflexus sp.]HYX38558.1 adenylate/guanylate cyclase domain-containing protein [Oligoflexus sp.]
MCLAFQHGADDYLIKSLCLVYESSIDYSRKFILWTEFIDKSRQDFPGTTAAARLAYEIGTTILYMHSDQVRTLEILKRGLAACPKQASWMSDGLKWMMASVYLFNPASSAHHRSQALQIYEEAKMFDDEVTKFNIGVAKLFYFNDPEGALKQFAKVKMAAARLVPDAIVFSAFTYSKLGRKKEALDELSSVRFDGSESPKRMAFLQCYMAMTKINSGTGEDLSDCFSLPDDTQADVVDHVTKEISMMSVPLAAENKLFRQFWRYYLKLILPSFQFQTEQSINLAELERIKHESERQKLALALAENDSRFKSYILYSALIFMSLMFFTLWRIYIGKRRIEVLQRYIQQNVLQRFLPPDIVEEVIKGKSRLEKEAQDTLITVLFCDIVGFTQLSEKLGAKRITIVLNDFMKGMTDVIYSDSGTIDKFIGDAVMVMFGAPRELTGQDQAQKAVNCATKMLLFIQTLNKKCQEEFGVELSIRIGVHQGMAIVGSFGSEKRSDYTAIGGTVNIASRIESKASPNQILVSPSVSQHLASSRLTSLGHQRLKGIESSMELFVYESTLDGAKLLDTHHVA